MNSMCSKYPPPERVHYLRLSRHWSIAASITFCSKSTQVCVKHFAGHRCHKSLFRTRIVAEHPKFYNLHFHFDEAYTIRLMQFSLVISHNTFLLFRLSRGNVAILITWDGWSSYHHIVNSNSENWIKIRWFFTKLQTKIRWLRFYGSRCRRHPESVMSSEIMFHPLYTVIHN